MQSCLFFEFSYFYPHSSALKSYLTAIRNGLRKKLSYTPMTAAL